VGGGIHTKSLSQVGGPLGLVDFLGKEVRRLKELKEQKRKTVQG